MEKKFDFSGWATRANLVCSDSRIIRNNAFAHQDGEKVPLFWNHQHNSPDEVLGHAILENRDEGVYAYCSFNDTEQGKTAKLLVQHGDIDRLSIWANKLKQQGSNVIHGMIREVSLVVAGANPGAYIDTVMAHGEGSTYDDNLVYEEGSIYCDIPFDYVAPLVHADDSEKGESKVAEETKKTTEANEEETIKDVLATFNEKQMKVLEALVGQALEDAKAGKAEETKEEVKHADESGDDEETIGDVLKTFNDKQLKVLHALVAYALEDNENNENDEDVKHSEGGDETMKSNIFDKETRNEEVLSHDAMGEYLAQAINDEKKLSSVFLSHGIEPIDILFPDATNLNKTPEFIKRDTTWVGDVMNGVHHTPFARIKSVFADITEADARAKGYLKGKIKLEEMFTLLKRVTTPTTIYKKQKLDRDDIIDITDFDIVPWIKQEMRMMLDEEIARAILVGDGRSTSSNDKINEQNIRPIWTDEEGYTVKHGITVTSNMTDDQKAKAFIRACIKSRKEYKGSGNPVMFITEDMLTDCLLLEDTNQRIIYDSMDKLATAMRVRKIIPVPVMEGLTRQVGANTHELAGIYVNLADYNVGADKGGAISLFDDFDIDFNQQKYLIETRISGALVKPFAAVAIEFVSAN